MIEMDESGVTYRALIAPWRSITIPWDDVSRLGFFRWGGGRGCGAVAMRTVFYVHTRHPAHYASGLQRWLSAWWNPELGAATIAIPLERLDLSALHTYKAFLDAIKTTFAPEIAEYNVIVSLHD